MAMKTRGDLLPYMGLPVLSAPTEDVTSRYSFGFDFDLGDAECTHVVTERSTGKRFSCRSIPKHSLRSRAELSALMQEVVALKVLSASDSTEKTATLVSAHEDSEAVHLVSELCDGGSLAEILATQTEGLPETEAAPLFRQLVRAVARCHEKGFVHRDLRPENVLLMRQRSDASMDSSASSSWPLEEDRRSSCSSSTVSSCSEKSEETSVAGEPHFEVRLGGFGSAIWTQGRVLAGAVAGQILYMSPEAISRRLSGLPGDMWSLGVILHVLLSGKLPFQGSTKEEVFASIQQNADKLLESDSWQKVSPAAKHVLRCLLNDDPLCRPSADCILALPWLAGEKTAPARCLGRSSCSLKERDLQKKGMDSPTTVLCTPSSPGNVHATFWQTPSGASNRSLSDLGESNRQSTSPVGGTLQRFSSTGKALSNFGRKFGRACAAYAAIPSAIGGARRAHCRRGEKMEEKVRA